MDLRRDKAFAVTCSELCALHRITKSREQMDRESQSPGWKVTLESTDKQFWFDSLQRSIAKASTVLPFLS